MYRVALLSLLVSTFSFSLKAQETPAYSNLEQGFEFMRELAIGGDYPGAKKLGYQILEEKDDYYDVALYLARIHGWESSYDSAYLIIDEVILNEPELFEAYQTCVDLAYWQDNLPRLDSCAEKALELEPGSEAILEKYNKARGPLVLQTTSPEIIARYSYDHFSQPYVRNWHLFSVGASLPHKWGTLVPYINYGFDASAAEAPISDIQLNLDAYLTLGKKNYAMLAYGFSPNGTRNYLPVHRAAAELWQDLPKEFVVSAGLRYFYWDQHFTFLTFSAEKYVGDWWFTLRNYLFFKEVGVSASFYLSGRRYFTSKYEHLTLTLGYGAAPDEPILVVSDLERLNALSSRLEYTRPINSMIRMMGMLGYSYEEYADQEYRSRIEFKIGAYFKIKK